jgi:cellulose synthase/poly-beta-1,6-N-acetylglucosamine synthase-like glycosyltransferase
MMTRLLVDIVLTTLACAALIPAATILVECVAALLPVRRRQAPHGWRRPRVAILVPAHDEGAVIAATLASLRPQLAAGDRLIVIADNCGDDTAAVARAHGAEVLERNDPQRHGKGYGLDFGVRSLVEDPPAIVVLVDADSIVSPNGIELIVREADVLRRPIQATNVLAPPPAASVGQQLSAFAFVVKNLVRPRGLARLGLPCLLTGSGMAIPWEALRQVRLATGRTAEDMVMGIDLALAGSAPLHCPEANLISRLRVEEGTAGRQRARWEHGHIENLGALLPRLLAAAWRERRCELLALAFELGVPPLSLLVLGCFGAAALSIVSAAAGASTLPLFILTAGGLMIVGAIGSAWLRFGRDVLPLRVLLSAPVYVVRKIPLYAAFLTGRQSRWKTGPRG